MNLNCLLDIWIAVLLVGLTTTGIGADIMNNGKGDIKSLWGLSTSSSSSSEDIGTNIQQLFRNAISTSNILNYKLWDEYRDEENGKFVIPYKFIGRFSQNEQAVIQQGMKAIADNTCVTVKPYNSEKYDYYMGIRNDEDGCWSDSIGRNATNHKHEIMLGDACVTHWTVVHELLHKIGLWHEHTRTDRDNYVTILWENINPEPSVLHNFNIVPMGASDSYGVPYDYRSVMHYPSKSTAAKYPGLDTIKTKDPQFQEIIGRARDASPSDYKKVCHMYNCSVCMGEPFVPTRGGGKPSPPMTTPSPMSRTTERPPVVIRSTTAPPITGVECDDCNGCIPDNLCAEEMMDAMAHPYDRSLFRLNCCGYCGNAWLHNYCRTRNWMQLEAHQEKGFCMPFGLLSSNFMFRPNPYSGFCLGYADCWPDSECTWIAGRGPGPFPLPCCHHKGPRWFVQWCNKLPMDAQNYWKARGFCLLRKKPTIPRKPMNFCLRCRGLIIPCRKMWQLTAFEQRCCRQCPSTEHVIVTIGNLNEGDIHSATPFPIISDEAEGQQDWRSAEDGIDGNDWSEY